MTPGSHTLKGVQTPKGYRYMYEQLDGSLLEPAECMCLQWGELSCPIDAHRVPAVQQHAEF